MLGIVFSILTVSLKGDEERFAAYVEKEIRLLESSAAPRYATAETVSDKGQR